jgi:hypothetical protein
MKKHGFVIACEQAIREIEDVLYNSERLCPVSRRRLLERLEGEIYAIRCFVGGDIE